MLEETQLALAGHLRVEAIYDDRVEVISDRKNQIVEDGLRTILRGLLQKPGVTPVEHAIHSLWVESSATALPTVSSTDTGPTGTVSLQYVFDRTADVDENVGGVAGLAEFRARVEKNEANGVILRAAGLYTRSDDDDPSIATDPKLFARQLFGAVPKDSSFALALTWRIQFSIL